MNHQIKHGSPTTETEVVKPQTDCKRINAERKTTKQKEVKHESLKLPNHENSNTRAGMPTHILHENQVQWPE